MSASGNCGLELKTTWVPRDSSEHARESRHACKMGVRQDCGRPAAGRGWRGGMATGGERLQRLDEFQQGTGKFIRADGRQGQGVVESLTGSLGKGNGRTRGGQLGGGVTKRLMRSLKHANVGQIKFIIPNSR